MFAYDDVPYDTEANAETHPSTIATLARLSGLRPAAPRTARVLEIGCGNGENLIAAATYLPRARFVGFDLAASAIAAGVAAATASGTSNVELFAADVSDVRAAGTKERAPGGFDYVVAHGMYSWVPRDVRADLLAVMRDALGPGGVGFVSVNALPGWELRRALRELARDATRDLEDPAARVAEALRIIEELARAGEGASGFRGALAAAAREYVAHVARATPPEAPFARYVFHDLLADVNEPFSVAGLGEDLARAGLRIVCEAPLFPSRAGAFDGLAADLARTGAPFLQVLVQRDDGELAAAPDASAAAELDLWADLTPAPGGGFRTTTGALVRPVGETGLARATRHAPGFVAVRDLADDDDARRELARQLFAAACEGVLTLVTERPGCATTPRERPCVAAHVRVRAGAAVERGAPSGVVTNALHRSFRVPWSELAVVLAMDGARTVPEIAAEATRRAAEAPSSLAGPLTGASTRDVQRFVDAVVDRFTRHLFLVEEDAT
ncbi:MAG: methyltransferase domain-containing protein [Labilithrix sp.]|nr:methyltransferase domain-containing protein [Labilithrix sp.]